MITMSYLSDHYRAGFVVIHERWWHNGCAVACCEITTSRRRMRHWLIQTKTSFLMQCPRLVYTSDPWSSPHSWHVMADKSGSSATPYEVMICDSTGEFCSLEIKHNIAKV